MTRAPFLPESTPDHPARRTAPQTRISQPKRWSDHLAETAHRLGDLARQLSPSALKELTFRRLYDAGHAPLGDQPKQFFQGVSQHLGGSGMEALENRVLLSAAIEGAVFADANLNGTRDVIGGLDETGLNNLQVYVDVNGNGQFDQGTDLTDTSSTENKELGQYRFEGLAAGTYQLGFVNERWAVTPLTGGEFEIVTDLGANETRTVNLGAVYLGEITGVLFDDVNTDGDRDDGEAGIGGQTIEVVDPETGIVEASAVTEADGSYVISGLEPTSWEVRLASTGEGRVQTQPAFGFGATVDMILGQQNNFQVDFGTVATGSVSGSVFADADGDGNLDGDEQAADGATAFVDVNGDGEFNPAGFETETHTYAGGNVTIGDHKSATQAQTADLVVSDRLGWVSDVNVTLSLDATVGDAVLNDYQVDLISPSGTVVELFYREGSGSEAMVDTTFDDEASGPIEVGDSEPYTASFTPSKPLSNFDQQDPNGTWTLRIRDTQSTGEGAVLTAWSLDLTTEHEAEPNATTDASGDFLIEGVEPGSVIVRADGSGLFSTSGDSVVVTSGTTVTADAVGVGEQVAVQIDSFTSQPWGFTATFSGTLDLAEIDRNDVSLVGDSSGQVDGSLIFDGNTVHFVAYGEMLADDTYTASITSGTGAFVDSEGLAIDGDGDNSAGGDFSQQFNVSNGSAVEVTLPSLSRGPDQGLDPANESDGGWPIAVSDPTGVTSISVTIDYDESLINVTGAHVNSAISGWTVTNVDTSAQGQVTITASGTALDGNDPNNVLILEGDVPLSATFGAAQALQVTNVSLNGGGIASVGGAAVHNVGFEADMNGDQRYNVQDVLLVAQLSTDVITGLPNYPKLVGDILSDTNFDGTTNIFDLLPLAQISVDLSQTRIAALPESATAQSFPGADPTLTVNPASSNVDAGDPLSVTVDLTATEVDASTEVAGIEFVIYYDTSRLDITSGDIALTGLAANWTAVSTNVDEDAGTIQVSAVAFSPNDYIENDQFGSLLSLDFTVAANAPDGVATINVVEPDETIENGDATLISDQGSNELVLTSVDADVQVGQVVTGGTITGNVFEDEDGDGVRDPGDDDLFGATVFLDLDADGVLDNDEPFATTGVDGEYTFADQAAGDYVVRVDASDSATTLTTPIQDTVTVTNGTGVVGPDFGFFVNAGITGTVYADVDGDGTQDLEEDGLQNITVFLDTDGDGTLDVGETSVETDAGGGFLFENLGPGTYEVTIEPTDIAGFDTTEPIAGTYTVDLTSGDAAVNRDFGVQDVAASATISGLVFNDIDGDGVQEAGEDGLVGEVVYLDEDDNGILDGGELTATTDAQGDYTFVGLAQGAYTIRVDTGASDTITSPATGFYDVNITSDGQDLTGQDFAVSTPASIAGTVFVDINGDGDQDVEDDGLANVTVFIDTDNDGILDGGEANVETDANGDYLFNDVAPGSVVITVDPNDVAAYTQTFPTTDGGDQVLTVTAGQSATGEDFGFQLTAESATISGVVYADTDGDGTQDQGENPLAGEVVYLDEDSNGILDAGEATAVTNAQGEYTFFGLAQGSYDVRVDVSAQTNVTQPVADFYTVLIDTDGEDITSQDFGLFAPGSISGQAYEDLNADGDDEGGADPALANWTIYIDVNGNDAFDDGTDIEATTDASGAYSFEGLTAGDYTRRQELDAGYFESEPGGSEYNVTLTAGGALSGNDFGAFQQGSITGQKFEDTDGDGVKDQGETGLENVTIYIDANGNGTLDQGETSTTTDAQGNYSFANLDPGDYTLREEVPAGYSQTLPGAGEYSLTLTSGDDLVDQDFGNFLIPPDPGSIAGVKYHDLDGDGVQDNDEPGLEGWTIFLDADDDGVLDENERSTATDATGAYSFANLEPGDYVVAEELQNGWIQSAPGDDGRNDVSVAEDQDVVGVNFGNYQLATISGVVFIDANANRTQDNGEQAQQGVTVFLDADADGTLDQGETSTTSAVDGSYEFDVEPGDYTVAMISPQGFVQTAPVGDRYDVTVQSGEASTDLDFGNRVFGEGFIIDSIDGRGSIEYTDEDGTTWDIRLIGDGTLNLIDDDAGGIDIEALNTNDRSRIIIRTDRGGDGEADIDDITVFGSINSIDGRTTNLTGDISISGSLSSRLTLDDTTTGQQLISIGQSDSTRGGAIIQLDQVDDLSIQSLTPIRQLSATVWTDSGTDDTLSAPSIGQLRIDGDRRNGIDGDFDANVTITGDEDARQALQNVRVDGDATGDWTVIGDVGNVFVGSFDETFSLDATGEVRNIRADGDIGGSFSADTFGLIRANGVIDAGINAISEDNRGNSIRGIFADGITADADIDAQGEIGNVRTNDAGIAGSITGATILSVNTRGMLTGEVVALEADTRGNSIRSISAEGVGSDATITAIGEIGNIRTNDGGLDGTITAESFGSLRTRGDIDALIAATGSDDRGNSVRSIAGDSFTSGFSFTAPGDAGIIRGSGDLEGTISARTVRGIVTRGDLMADVTATGQDDRGNSIRILRTGAATGANITALGEVGNVRVSDWDGGVIDVGSLRNFRVTGDRRAELDGDFTGTLLLADNGDDDSAHNIFVAGAIDNALIESDGHIRSISASQLIDSEILLGIDNGFVTGNGMVPDQAADFDSNASLNRLRLTGIRGNANAPSMSNSLVAANNIDRIQLLAPVESPNGGTNFGIAVNGSVGQIQRAEAGGGRSVLRDINGQGQAASEGDFRLVVV